MNSLFHGIKSMLFFILFLSITFVYGNPVDQNRARKAGVNFLTSNTELSISKDFSDCRLAYQKTVENAQGEQVVCFYIFNIADKGFVIVSADDAAKPILGYSTESGFDANDIPSNLAVYIDSYSQSIAYAIENKIVNAKTLQEWDMTENNRLVNKSGRSVNPLLGELTWHQNCFYNSLCPEDPDGSCGHVYAGCVATAMAQIIKFWELPATGTGVHSYVPSGYPQQSVNYGETTYNYSIMPDKLDSTSTEEEIFAVAQLQWHCGVAVDMMYGDNGSGAYSNDVPEALISHFSFADEMNYCMRDNYSLLQWQNMLKESFNAGVPVYYSAQDDGGAGGHAFVCDGYDDNDLFHFNWGWNGRDNGYFAIDALNPGSTNYQFNTWQSGIFNVIPSAVLNAKAQAPTNFTITPAPNYGLSATLSWTNPSLMLSGNPLTSIISIQILRNGSLIHTIENPTIGANLSWTDNSIPALGGYAYSVYAVTEIGNGEMATQSVGIGPYCPITVELSDTYGDGWNGASIDFATEDGSVVESITLQSGASATESLTLPQGEIQCVWNSGAWDNEISFAILNSEGTQIYTCSNADDISGTFFTFDNQCENPPVECNAPSNFAISPDNESADAPAMVLSWDAMPLSESYNIYLIVNQEAILVATTEWTESFVISNNSQSVITLDFDVEYCFAVTCNCEESESELSEIECAVIELPLCPIPSNLSIAYNEVPESPVFTLSWDAMDNAVSYKVFRDNEMIGTSETNSFEDENVELNVEYAYSLSTVCLHGESEQSAAVPFIVSYEQIIENVDNINLYPNPANDRVEIKGANWQKVMIYNMLGQMIDETTQSSINTSSYENDVYLFRIVASDGTIVSKRVVISH